MGGQHVVRKIELDATAKAEPVQIERSGADVFQLDVFEVVGVVGVAGRRRRRVVHDLRDAQRRNGEVEAVHGLARPDTVGRRVVRAGEILVGRIPGAGKDANIVGDDDRDRAVVGKGGGRNGSARQTWIGAVTNNV